MIQIAKSEQDLIDCFPVIRQLRPNLEQKQFIDAVNTQAAENYQIAFLRKDTVVVSVAGFRYLHCLAWGKFLYVDDLVSDAQQRSQGYGKQMLDWLCEQARENHCSQLHLDSGVQRTDAHRFYEREGMQRMAYHFAIML